MKENQAYHVVKYGNKATRRDYSKVSSGLGLPDLVEIQTESFDWFLREGIQEVFDGIFPITNHSESIRLKFLGYRLEDPVLSIAECKFNQVNYCAKMYGDMELEMIDQETGEVLTKREDVYLGELPLMTPGGTFIINGAERVIVSQIVRSPGAYFGIESEDRTGRDTYTSELIPARGTWLEFLTDEKKSTFGRVVMTSVDRHRKILSTIFLKAIGLSLNRDKKGEIVSLTDIQKFLKALHLPVYKDVIVPDDQTEALNEYALLYTSIFGNYEELRNSLAVDKLATTSEALYTIYQNQRQDEIATVDGAISLLDSRFFDHKAYDLTKAGRYKVRRKLNILDRLIGHEINENLVGADGKVLVKKGSIIERSTRNVLREEINKGIMMSALPFTHSFSHPDAVAVNTSWKKSLVGRVLSKTIEGEYSLEQGTVLTEEDVKALSKEYAKVQVYAGIYANRVKVSNDNVNAVLNLGDRLFQIGRVTVNGEDLLDTNNEVFVERYLPNVRRNSLSLKQQDIIVKAVMDGKDVSVWLVGAAVQTVEINVANQAIKIIGIDPLNEKETITISDIYALYNYQLTMLDGVGTQDDIDMLSNRRIRTMGELLQNQYRLGLSRAERTIKDRMSISDTSSLTPKTLVNIRPLTTPVKEFFSASQLSQFMDQENPLAELSNKRRISALGPGGLTRERAGFEVRDIHNSHYGRICPIETPEGPNIGLISYLTTYAKVNQYGFIETPYRKVKNGIVTDEVVYMDAEEENEHVIAQSNAIENGKLVGERVVARIAGETVMAEADKVDFADVSPRQIVSVATACVPFLENDDCTRALMGANMQRQAVPLLNPHSPYVGTGMEHMIARYSGEACVATAPGMVTYVDANRIVVAQDDGTRKEYKLTKYSRSNASTCINQKPIVLKGERIERGDILADGPSMENGELALGQNVTIAFMTWKGYNYEDAIIMSEKMQAEDYYTSVHIEEYSLECRNTKLGDEEITYDIPNVAEAAKRNLDARGIIREGADVKEGDILVGKVTPKGQTDVSPEEKLLLAIFGEKSREVRDNSLKVPHGGAGTVLAVREFRRTDKGVELKNGVKSLVKVFIVQKRKISEGDKMAGRHGNKGVISRINPVEDMPFMADGTPIDVMLNPFGVPSRMNIGQVLEVHLGLAAKRLGVKFATPVFDGVSNDDLRNIMKEAGSSEDGKYVLYDGMTGEAYDERISVGVMYMIKLAHMVDDKLHARATGPYSLVTQQPLGGKAQNGGQRFGEMEVWALEAYGASHTLQEILTVKSDDIVGRTKTYESIVKGKDMPTPGIPESFRVLVHELQSLAIDVRMLDKDGREMDLKDMEQQDLKEETMVNSDAEMVNDAHQEDGFMMMENDEEVVEAAEVGIDEGEE